MLSCGQILQPTIRNYFLTRPNCSSRKVPHPTATNRPPSHLEQSSLLHCTPPKWLVAIRTGLSADDDIHTIATISITYSCGSHGCSERGERLSRKPQLLSVRCNAVPFAAYWSIRRSRMRPVFICTLLFWTSLTKKLFVSSILVLLVVFPEADTGLDATLSRGEGRHA